MTTFTFSREVECSKQFIRQREATMRHSIVATALVAVFLSYLGTPAPAKAAGYDETDLVADKKPLTDKNGIVHNAQVQDPNLKNPWGITSSGPPPFWISDNATGLVTIINVTTNSVSIAPQVVRIPTPVSTSGGTPTGAVFNVLFGFRAVSFPVSGVDKNGAPKSASAIFLFATEDGTIVGWNPDVGLSASDFNGPVGPNGPVSTQGIIALDNSGNNFTNPNPSAQTGAVYKGLAFATVLNDQPPPQQATARLYVTNFRSGKVEMYNTGFMALGSPPAFVDPKLPHSYAPFNIVLINGSLVVTYAVQNATKHDDVAGEGHGIVNVFELDGTFRQRFDQHGQLNSPWGVALAPSNFGSLAGKLWIGNFGNGHINAYDPDTGRFINKVRDHKLKEIVIDGLWALKNGTLEDGTESIYFTAGPNGETDGLFGSLTPHP
jgi:uncharacterized protein (TIGR03118 family)